MQEAVAVVRVLILQGAERIIIDTTMICHNGGILLLGMRNSTA